MVLEHGHWRHVRRGILRSCCVSLYCCKGTPCTFPFWLLISDSSSELKLMLKLNYFNWTRLEVSTSDCRLLSRLHDCGLRMSPIRFKEILRMIPPWRESQGSGRRSPPLARGFPSSTSRWDGTIWDQYQRCPNFGEIPGPELGDEPPLRAGSLPKRRKDVASWRCRKKLRTGLGNCSCRGKFLEISGMENFRKFPTSFFHFLTGYWKFILLIISRPKCHRIIF